MNAQTRQKLRVAVVGAGPAGAACAAALHAAGVAVTVFEKSRGVGGRMATRRTRYTDARGHEQAVHFDHGAQHVQARDPGFLIVMQTGVAAGGATPWPLHLRGVSVASASVSGSASVTAVSPEPETRFLPLPGMPAFCQHLLRGSAVQLQHTVVGLLPQAKGGYVLRFAEHGAAAPGAPHDDASHFDQVVLAMPPPQAAALLTSLHPVWSQALLQKVMRPCWTLMVVTDAPEPASDAARAMEWDAAVPADGPLVWVSRNDRRPGRATPAGTVSWVAQASAAWTEQHLEDDAPQVTQALLAALFQVLGAAATPVPRVHLSAVHRWRYALAVPAQAIASDEAAQPWWDPCLGLGVCGDSLLGTDVEAAWRSGDSLAQALLAALRSRSTEA